MAVSERVIEQCVELLQRFVRLRLDLMLPEHLVQFKQQMEKSRGNSGSLEDITFLFRIFTILAQAETPPTMGEMSSELGVPLSTATRIVDWLVRAQFVERVNDAHDRRVVRVHMTDSGAQLYHLGMEYNKQQIRQVLKNFTADEQAQLLRLLNKLVDALVAEK
jgi:DNA-binding MarR family transcriptional regulator